MEWKKGVMSGIIAGIVMLLIGLVFMMIPFTPGVTQWYSVTFPEMSSPMAMSIMMAGIVLSGIFMGLVYSVINSAIPGEVDKWINHLFNSRCSNCHYLQKAINCRSITIYR